MKNFKNIGLLVTAVLVISGCTKLSPELGFGNLASDGNSLTLNSEIKTINLENINSTLVFNGSCETNMNMKLTAKDVHAFKCTNASYSVSVLASAFPDGEHAVMIEAYDDSNNKIGSKELKILKDTVAPTLTLLGPSTVAGNTYTVPLTGACSENNINISVTETSSGIQKSATCAANTWQLNFDYTGAQTVFRFSAALKDLGQNQVIAPTITVNKITLANFSVLGVNTGDTSMPSGVLKLTTGSIKMEWTSSTGAANYTVKIALSELQARTILCQFDGVAGLTLTKVISSQCPGIVHSKNYVLIVEAVESGTGERLVRELPFISKAPPSIAGDASILYVNSNTSSPITTDIQYSNFISDAHSNGPFTVTLVSEGALSGQLSLVTGASPALRVSPAVTTSGVTDLQIRIADENGLLSNTLTLKIAVVYPYSWTGAVSDNFNNKENWCGVASLKTGCPGQTQAPNSSSVIIIDNLCGSTPGTIGTNNCIAKLNVDTTVQSFYLKDKAFYHNTNSFTVGSLHDATSLFEMSGGIYNDVSSTGDLTVYRKMKITGGLFTAAAGSNISVNTNAVIGTSDFFSVSSANFFVHNNSTFRALDPAGNLGAHQSINVPTDFTFKNLIIDSHSGSWGISSSNLIVEGDLTLSGTNSPVLKANPNSKITLHGNINCIGTFDGGSIPIYIASASAKYKTTVAGCKMPFLKILAGASLTEDASSTQSLTVNGLVIASGGTFRGPGVGHSTIIKSKGLENDTIVADLTTGYTHNNAELFFETADSSVSKYRVKLNNEYSVTFRNPANDSTFYELQNNFSTSSFTLAGANPIPLKGSAITVISNALILGTGMVIDSARLDKLVLTSSEIAVNTSTQIGLKNIEFQTPTVLNGSATSLNFTDTTLILGANDVSIPSGKNLFYLTLTKTTGNLLGPGTPWPQL